MSAPAPISRQYDNRETEPNTHNNVLYNRERVNSLQYVNISLNNKLDNKTLLGLTDTISVRVPLLYKLLFKEIRKDPLKWRVFKESLLSLIKSISESNIEPSTNVNIQLSPTIVINNVKAEAKTEISIDIDSVLNEIAKLKRLISSWARTKLIPPAAHDTASNLIKTIEKQLKAVN